MPPKMIRCCICSQDVMKSQTYATGEKGEDGTPLRACKEHEGVVEKAEELKEKHLKEERQNSRLNPAQRNHASQVAYYRKNTSPEQQAKDHQMLGDAHDQLTKVLAFGEWARNHCWCCRLPGIPLRDFYQLKLIALEKGKILDVLNPFSKEMGEIIKGLMNKLEVKCVIHHFDLDDNLFKIYEEWKGRIRRECHEFVQIGKSINLCFDCQERTGIKFDLEAHMPKFDLSTLATIGAVYEGSGIQKAVQVLGLGSVVQDREEIVKKSENN